MINKTTKKVERLPLTDDYIFKRVFAFKGNESVYLLKITSGLKGQKKRIKK